MGIMHFYHCLKQLQGQTAGSPAFLRPMAAQATVTPDEAIEFPYRWIGQLNRRHKKATARIRAVA
jgi:hypothetical protein